MSLPELIGRLERDAKAKADALAESAREQIAQIEAEADRAAGKVREEELSVRRAKRRSKLDRELAEARARSRAGVLRAREELIDRVFERARALLPGLISDRRTQRLIAAGVAEAATYLGECSVRCPPAFAEAAATPGVKVVIDPSAPPGARLESGDGRVSVDLSLERQLASSRPRLSIALVKELSS